MTGDHLERLRAWRRQLNADHRAWYERNGHAVPEPLHPADEEVPCHFGCGTDLRGPDGEHLPLLLADIDKAMDELEQLRSERDAWREGVVTRLEQVTGQKVTLMLTPKDQCPATFAAEVRWDFQCEKLGGHAELHRVRISGGFVEWRGAEDVAADAVPQQEEG